MMETMARRAWIPAANHGLPP
eukprot:SAG25_NODE_13970_length_260_cov_1.285714_1_plen_20_part_01